jgi:ArsR family metal-binding transcriptional regulator
MGQGSKGWLHPFSDGSQAMLVNYYHTRYVRPPNPSAQHLRCYADLDGDIGAVLPYLNAWLKGHQFSPDPPSLTIKLPGKLVTLTSHEIAINIVKDQTEAEEILEWLKQEINETWERRGEIIPRFEVAAQPRVLDLLRLLPRTNCRACGQPTCMVFAVRLGQGTQGLHDCPDLDQESQRKLEEYLSQFQLSI